MRYGTSKSGLWRKAALASAIVACAQMAPFPLSTQRAAAEPSACPTFVPMFGLMPLLIKVGILPKVAQAATIAPADTADSTVITADLGNQMQCGKTKLQKFENITFSKQNLENGKSSSLKLDILVPDDGKPHPLVIYITGGGFVVAPKEAAPDLRTYVAEAGFAVASIEYSTARDGATYKDGIEQVKAAVRFLRKNAQAYRIDAASVAIWGESAGGYLAAMAGAANHVKLYDVGDNLDQSSAVQAVIVKFGATDVSKIADDFDDQAKKALLTNEAIISYIGADSTGKALDIRNASTAANPITYITEDAPPFLILHGEKDALISPSQTEMLHEALLKHGAKSSRYIVAGANHGDLAFINDKQSGLYWTSKDVMDVMLSFLNKFVKNDAK